MIGDVPASLDGDTTRVRGLRARGVAEPGQRSEPELVSQGAAGGVCSLVVAYEAIRYRESRVRVRHPESLARMRSFVALQGNPATNFVPKTCPQNVRLGGFAVGDPLNDAV